MSGNKFGKKSVLVALFAAIISAGAFIQIPLPGGVPVTIQDMLAMLSGMLLGPVYGGLAVLLFLFLGCMGLPVFTGKAGINVILYGPTGGFLIGYLLSAIAGGLLIHFLVKPEKTFSEQGELIEASKETKIYNWVIITLISIVQIIVLFALGIIFFCHVKPDFEFQKVLSIVLIPFIPGNIIKLIISVPLVKRLRPAIKNFLD